MSLQDRLDQLAPRERQLLGVLVAIVVAFVVLGVPGALLATASSQRTENEALRDAVRSIEKAQAALAKSEEKREAILARYRTPAPELAAWLDRLARAQELEALESQDRAMVPHGKKYEERATKVLFRRAGLGKLVRFMESIEKSPYPVLISKLNIRKRGATPDSFDVEMIVSAFDRKEPAKKPLADAEAVRGVGDEREDEGEEE